MKELNPNKQDLFYLILEVQRKRFYLENMTSDHFPLRTAVYEVLSTKVKNAGEDYYMRDIIYSIITTADYISSKSKNKYFCFEQAILQILELIKDDN